MKIGCDACGQAEAAVLCCADEAALCRRCDAAVHSANKLAGRHHRVALLSSTPACSSPPGQGDDGGSHPACDICQEKTGYFFCVEDRALLCRSCDVAVHTASPHVSAHRRFLITGVRVGAAQDHIDADPSGAAAIVSPSSSSANGSNSVPTSGNLTVADNRLSVEAAGLMEGGEDDVGQQQQWPWSDIFADDGVGMDQHQCYPGFSEPGSSSLTG
ncbi:B-box zinc finger protein 22-like [Lolium rigidum]|uniref:B-box zinc finger protein 22-like n=1 Tax=Lolium rigidum TaxID=89674 RepID=UPI001F5C2F17|nr:B-box zinc finger protein 22-like [Lolium rigidum]